MLEIIVIDYRKDLRTERTSIIVDSFLHREPHHPVRIDLAYQRLRVLPVVISLYTCIICTCSILPVSVFYLFMMNLLAGCCDPHTFVDSVWFTVL